VNRLQTVAQKFKKHLNELWKSEIFTLSGAYGAKVQ